MGAKVQVERTRCIPAGQDGYLWRKTVWVASVHPIRQRCSIKPLAISDLALRVCGGHGGRKYAVCVRDRLDRSLAKFPGVADSKMYFCGDVRQADCCCHVRTQAGTAEGFGNSQATFVDRP